MIQLYFWLLNCLLQVNHLVFKDYFNNYLKLIGDLKLSFNLFGIIYFLVNSVFKLNKEKHPKCDEKMKQEECKWY